MVSESRWRTTRIHAGSASRLASPISRFSPRRSSFARTSPPKGERAFFESGDALVASMFRAIELQLSPYFNPSAILEYGCGAGRLAIPLARRSARNAGSVTAVDRSPAMLAAARQEAERHGVSNVEFQTPAALFAGGRTFDFITCYFVLQRLPPDEGLPLLAALLERLTPKGVGSFTCRSGARRRAAVKALRWIRHSVPAANALVNMARRRPSGEPFVPALHLRPGARVRGDSSGRHRDHARRVRAARGARDGAAVHGEAGRATRCRDLATTSGGPIDVAELVEHTTHRGAQSGGGGVLRLDHAVGSSAHQAVQPGARGADAAHRHGGADAGTAADGWRDRARFRSGHGMVRPLPHAARLPRHSARRVRNGARDGARAVSAPAGHRRPAGAGVPRCSTAGPSRCRTRASIAS